MPGTERTQRREHWARASRTMRDNLHPPGGKGRTKRRRTAARCSRGRRRRCQRQGTASQAKGSIGAPMQWGATTREHGPDHSALTRRYGLCFEWQSCVLPGLRGSLAGKPTRFHHLPRGKDNFLHHGGPSSTEQGVLPQGQLRSSMGPLRDSSTTRRSVPTGAACCAPISDAR